MGNVHVMDANTVAYWPMREARGRSQAWASTLTDTKGERTLTGAASFTDAEGNRFARTFRKASAGHYAERTADATFLALAQSNAWTLSGWFRFASAVAQTLFGSVGGTTDTEVYNSQMNLAMDGSGKLYYFIETGAGANTQINFSGMSALSADTWYHLGLTYDGTNLRLYVDGSLADTQACATVPTGGTSSRITLGRNAFQSPTYSDYDCRSVMISDVVRDLAWMQTEAARATMLHAEDANTFAHWACDVSLVDDVPFVEDVTDNAHHLAVSGAPAPIATSEEGVAFLGGDYEHAELVGPVGVEHVRTALAGECTIMFTASVLDLALGSSKGVFLFADPGVETQADNYFGVAFTTAGGFYVEWEHSSGTTGLSATVAGALDVDDAEFHHWALVKEFVSGSDYRVKVYKDGELIGTTGNGTNYDGGTNGFVRLGTTPSETNDFFGILRDLSISDVARSEGFIAAEAERALGKASIAAPAAAGQGVGISVGPGGVGFGL